MLGDGRFGFNAFVQRIPFAGKVLLAVVGFSLTTAVLLGYFSETADRELRFTRRELCGDRYNRVLRGIVEKAQALGTVKIAPAAGGSVADEIDRLFASLDSLHDQDCTDGSYRDELQIGEPYERLGRSWREAQTALDGAPESAGAAYAALLRDLFHLYAHVGDRSNLILDPELDTYYVIDLLLLQFPEAATSFLGLVAAGEAFDLAILDGQMPEMDGMALAREIRRHRSAPMLALIMLASLGRREAGAESAEFAAFLTKPVKESQLFEALTAALGGSSPSEERGRASAEAEATAMNLDVGLAERSSLGILLAEDNLTNQRVALLLLRRLGCQADVAANGIEVLQALERRRYDLVLMDVHMPEMDGLDATRRIRAELGRESQPVIIAMTADAMDEDRELCLAAGMDDYLSKPVEISKLRVALERAWRQRAA